MREDEYIDLDKINMMPKEGELPGFSKPKAEEQKPSMEKKTEIQQEKTEIKKAPEPKKTVTNKNKTKKTKKKTKKASVNSKPRKKQNTSKKPIYLLIGLILIAIIVIAVATIFSGKEDEMDANKALMLINGEPLYEDEVKTRADWLRLLNGMPISDEEVLELSIEIDLLHQEAKKRNMSISDEELNLIFEDMAMSVQMTPSELQEYIEGFGINIKTLRKVFKKELLAGELAEKEMHVQELTEEELKQYYEENKHTFIYDEHAKIKHIQINQENKTDEETYKKAESVKQKLNENMSNFCELTKEYSNEWITMDSCGEYVIETQITHQDELFIKALELEDGEVKIIKTTDGYHVTWREETTPAGISKFEEVKEVITSRLLTINAEKKYAQLLNNLRAEATIEDYVAQIEDEEVIEIDLSELLQELENETDLTNKETLEEEIIEEEIETETEVSEEMIAEEEKITEKAELIIIYETTEETDDVRKLRLAKCLTNNGAKMYDVYWSPHGDKQAKEFGEYFEHIIRLECDADGINPKLAECQNVLKKQYPTWPTWLINGELHEGYQNINSLARISGCEN